MQIELGQPAEAVSCLREARAIQEQAVARAPKNADEHSRLGAIANDLGAALALLGRHDEVLAAYRCAVEHQRVALDLAPRTPRYRQFLSNHYFNLALHQRQLGRPEEAAAATRERQHLWPDNPTELVRAAGELARCIPLVARGQTDLTAEEEDQRRRYGDEALKVLQQAVAKGFRNSDQLAKDPALAPLRDREDFQKLLTELRAKAK
jgi:tetratricopeptide (TPR) repeat protein